jgi:hypothetical protein
LPALSLASTTLIAVAIADPIAHFATVAVPHPTPLLPSPSPLPPLPLPSSLPSPLLLPLPRKSSSTQMG